MSAENEKSLPDYAVAQIALVDAKYENGALRLTLTNRNLDWTLTAFDLYLADRGPTADGVVEIEPKPISRLSEDQRLVVYKWDHDLAPGESMRLSLRTPNGRSYLWGVDRAWGGTR